MPSWARLLSPPRQAGVQQLPRPVLKGTPLNVCSTCFKMSRCSLTSPCRPGQCASCGVDPAPPSSGVSLGCGRAATSARGRGEGWRRAWFGLRWLARVGLHGHWWHARGSDGQARGQPGRRQRTFVRALTNTVHGYAGLCGQGGGRSSSDTVARMHGSMQPRRGNVRRSLAAPNLASARRAQRGAESHCLLLLHWQQVSLVKPAGSSSSGSRGTNFII
jgi:hypothetical protein